MSRMTKRRHTKRFLHTFEAARRYTGLPRYTRTLSKIGLVKIKLSTRAQMAVNCVIGVDVDLENPWVYIKKEKIEDHLDLHSENSEFLPVASKIRSYPESDLLVCLKRIRDNPDSKDVFIICPTVEVKSHILKILESNHLKINNAVYNFIEKMPGVWYTFGSEKEIIAETMRSIRPLFAVEIECGYPIIARRTLSVSFAYPDNGNFVEFLTKKRIPHLVYKRRMTSSVQVAPKIIDCFSQTMQVCPRDQITQTKYEFTVKNLSARKYKELLYFLNQIMYFITDRIHLNANIDLYNDDYEQLVLNQIKNYYYHQKPLKYFSNIKYSRNKYVSTLVWHPKISGLVAVAYTNETQNTIKTADLSYIELEFSKNVVLIWCYSFCMEPKLILHSDQEIVSLCFCPHNVDILIGGCINGQIVIWDLTNKLERVESDEIMLTPEEERHRAIMESFTNWMLLSNDVSQIKPTAVSNVLASHRNAVTGIYWMSANFECTKNGNIVKTTKTTKPFMGGQFITCSLDGFISFWDLEKTYQRSVTVKRKVRKVHIPSLYKISPYRKLNNVMTPVFKITIDIPLTKLLIPDQQFIYETINPETADNIFERTYFKAIKSDSLEEFSKQFIAVTNTGSILTFTWSGYDYDQGNIINFVQAENVTFLRMAHETPIHTCVMNPIDNNLLLTISGKVFAVWNCELDSKALVWRKSIIRYSTGLWSVNNIGVILIHRVDSKIELWDILVDSKLPSLILEQVSTPIINTFLDYKLTHVRKETYFKSDNNGNLILTALMSKEENRTKNHFDNSVILDFGKRIVERRKVLREWLNNWKEKYFQPIESLNIDESNEIKKDTMVIAEEEKAETDSITNEKLEEEEFEKEITRYIVEKKKIDPVDIEKFKNTLIRESDHKEDIQNKLNCVLERSVNIYKSRKTSILERPTEIKQKKKKTPSCYKKDSADYDELKKNFMLSYYEIEKDILSQLETISPSDIFEFPALLEKRRSLNKNYAYGEEELLKYSETYICLK